MHENAHLHARRAPPPDALARRPPAARDARHRPADPRRPPDGLVRSGRRRHRRARARARQSAGRCSARVVDRRGQTLVLVAGASVCARLLLCAVAVPAGRRRRCRARRARRRHRPRRAAGRAPACARSCPPCMPDPGAARSVYAVEASAVEFTWVARPADRARPRRAALDRRRARDRRRSRCWPARSRSPRSRARASGGRRPRGAGPAAVRCASGAMQTLVIALVAVGVLVGAVEVARRGRRRRARQQRRRRPAARHLGPRVARRAACSRRASGGGARGASGLALVLAALTAGHLALAAAAAASSLMGSVLFAAGAAIAPTFASAYAMVDRAAPAGAVTEAFAWLATALAVGGAAGAAAGGAVADGAGPAAAFAARRRRRSRRGARDRAARGHARRARRARRVPPPSELAPRGGRLTRC